MIIIDKKNRNKFIGVAGTYLIVDENDKPVIKKKLVSVDGKKTYKDGKPWGGRTFNMGNYFGVIVGSAKYNKSCGVRLGAVWQDGYKIQFTPQEQQNDK